MKTLFKSDSQTKSVDGYVEALARRLHGSLPAEKAVTIVEETKAHLRDRVEDLVFDGVERSVAEGVAVVGFGPVAQFSRAVIRSAYEDSLAVKARLGAAILGICLLGLPFCLLELTTHFPPAFYTPWLGNFPWGVLAFLAGVAGFCLFSLCGKRPQTRLFATIAFAVTVCAFVYAGFDCISTTPYGMVSRKQVASELAVDPAYRANVDRDVHLLQLGNRVFATANPTIPAELLNNGGIIIPNVVEWAEGGADTAGALRVNLTAQQYASLPWGPDRGDAEDTLRRNQPYIVAADLTEARAAWQDAGARWLRERTATLQAFDRNERIWAQIRAADHGGFDLAAARFHGSFFAGLGIALLTLETIFAYMGRFAYRFWKNRRYTRIA